MSDQDGASTGPVAWLKHLAASRLATEVDEESLSALVSRPSTGDATVVMHVTPDVYLRAVTLLRSRRLDGWPTSTGVRAAWDWMSLNLRTELDMLGETSTHLALNARGEFDRTEELGTPAGADGDMRPSGSFLAAITPAGETPRLTRTERRHLYRGYRRSSGPQDS